jgi:TPR repeat protein
MALEGVVSLDQCTAGESCVSAAEALFQYSTKERAADDDSTTLNLSLHASPWRLYDMEKRIITIEEVAEMVKPFIAKGAKRIVLKASWTGVSPDRGEKSLATKLSEALGGFPVEGFDGFLWIAEDGSTRTTHQATTLFQGGGPYKIRPGSEVMVSMVAGWPAPLEDIFLRNKDADGIKDAGAGWDIFFLCPDRALQAFEAAARYANPIAAYNAALIRLERKSKGDLKAAAELLSQAANAGDKKAQERLKILRRQHR